jgi:hypothetical protein
MKFNLVVLAGLPTYLRFTLLGDADRGLGSLAQRLAIG